MVVIVPKQGQQNTTEIMSGGTTISRAAKYLLIAWMDGKNNYGIFETEMRNNTEIHIGRPSDLERKLLERAKNASPIRKDEMYILVYEDKELKVAVPMGVYDRRVAEAHVVIKPNIEWGEATTKIYANGLTGIGGRYLVEDPKQAREGKGGLSTSPLYAIVLGGPDPCFYAKKGGKTIAYLSNNDAALLVLNPCRKNYHNVLVAVYNREQSQRSNALIQQ